MSGSNRNQFRSVFGVARDIRLGVGLFYKPWLATIQVESTTIDLRIAAGLHEKANQIFRRNPVTTGIVEMLGEACDLGLAQIGFRAIKAVSCKKPIVRLFRHALLERSCSIIANRCGPDVTYNQLQRARLDALLGMLKKFIHTPLHDIGMRIVW